MQCSCAFAYGMFAFCSFAHSALHIIQICTAHTLPTQRFDTHFHRYIDRGRQYTDLRGQTDTKHKYITNAHTVILYNLEHFSTLSVLFFLCLSSTSQLSIVHFQSCGTVANHIYKLYSINRHSTQNSQTKMIQRQRRQSTSK